MAALVQGTPQLLFPKLVKLFRFKSVLLSTNPPPPLLLLLLAVSFPRLLLTVPSTATAIVVLSAVSKEGDRMLSTLACCLMTALPARTAE
jgi:hypothetical protein